MEHHDNDGYIAVIGLGYVGLPLAATLAASGAEVVGLEANPAVRAAIRAGGTLKYEPGLEDLLRSLPEGALTVSDRLPDAAPAAVLVCVGTAVDGDRRPELDDLSAAVSAVADRIDEDTLVVIRSTVPVGTCRDLVLPLLRRRVASPLLAFCPERTIQGQALAELRALPQIIGGLDARSAQLAADLFKPVAPDQIMMSSIEAAEAVKLICNAHTDLIYGFGNEVAFLSHALGLDAEELIESANAGYPRPNLSRPGFVGGSCLVKDPYLLAHAGAAAGYRPTMVEAARAVNERVPGHVANVVLRALSARRRPAVSRVVVCGIAYKGHPPTDDVRGSAAVEVARLLTGQVGELAGHDFLVAPERTAELGYRPVELPDGLDGAHALILLSNHPGYSDLDSDELLRRMAPSPVVFDMWGVLRPRPSAGQGVEYLGLGRG